MLQARILFASALLAVSPLLAQETIGPWSIVQAPQSATATIAPGAADWGNVVNVPVTLNQAFSGFSIIDDGWINIATGDFYEVTFVPPVVNNAGADLVVFDARYDAGEYSLRTSYDGFAAAVATAGWVDSGVDRSYYYGGFGPYAADVWGAPVDLSDFGVPLGAGVSSVRVTATNSACDALGVGALGPVGADLEIDKTASPDPVVTGGQALTYTITVTNLGPEVANSVVVTDLLPAAVTFVSASGTGWACGEAAGTVTCTAASLAVGVAPAITIEVIAPQFTTSILNEVSVDAETADPAAGNNQADVSVDVEWTTLVEIPTLSSLGLGLLALLMAAAAFLAFRRARASHAG